MTNEEKLAAIDFWQDEAPFHPLTCGVQSSHEILRGREVNGEVILYCPTCADEQGWVPGIVYKAYALRGLIKEQP